MRTTTSKWMLCAMMMWTLSMMHLPLIHAQPRSDEDLIRDAIRIFRDRFNVKDFASLSGQKEPPRILRPVHAPGSSRRPMLSSTPAPEITSRGSLPMKSQTRDVTAASQDSLLRFEAVEAPVEPARETEKTYPPVVLASKRPVKQRYFCDITTSGQEYSSTERKELKEGWFALFEKIPPDVQIAFREEQIHVKGNTATVTARYVFRRRSLTRQNERFAGMEDAVTFHLRKEAGAWKIQHAGEFLNTMKDNLAD